MIYLFSFFMILLEVSLPFNGNMYGVTLAFVAYLVNLNKERGVCLVIGISLIHSLQTVDFIRISLILVGGYYLISYLFTHLTYGKSNIVLITIVQVIIYVALSINNLKKEYLIVNICSFIILNYIYMKISKKKDNIKG